MDSITDLPPCGGFNGIYTCIDKLTNFVKFIPILIGEGALVSPWGSLPFLWACCVQSFGIPHVVLHNCDAHFTAHFWRCLWEWLGYQVPLSLVIPSTVGWADWMYSSDKGIGYPLCYDLVGVPLRIVGANFLAQSNWLSIQLFRIL